MGGMRICVFLWIFGFYLTGPVFSETIMLKSGRQVEGRIVEETKDYIKLDLEGVMLTYYKDEIDAISPQGLDSAGEAYKQLQVLYQGYNASQQAAPQPKPKQDKQEAKGTSAPVKAPQDNVQMQPGDLAAPPDLSKLPAEYQDMIRSAFKEGAQPSGATAQMPDLSRLPDEYREAIKTALAKRQPGNANPGDKKQQ